jgi:hypothetical protein
MSLMMEAETSPKRKLISTRQTEDSRLHASRRETLVLALLPNLCIGLSVTMTESDLLPPERRKTFRR